MTSAVSRAAMSLHDPRSFRAEEGEELRGLFPEIRSVFAGRELPAEIPMEPLERDEDFYRAPR